jgi:hypothetical protein
MSNLNLGGVTRPQTHPNLLGEQEVLLCRLNLFLLFVQNTNKMKTLKTLPGSLHHQNLCPDPNYLIGQQFQPRQQRYPWLTWDYYTVYGMWLFGKVSYLILETLELNPFYEYLCDKFTSL